MNKETKKELAAVKARMQVEQDKAMQKEPANQEPKKDGRAKTSEKNGKKGGRPPVLFDIANAFIRAQGEPFPIRRYRRQWYRYNGRIWVAQEEEEIGGEVMGYLRRFWPGRATGYTRGGVMHHMMSFGVSMLDSKMRMPCWLPEGEDASDWRAMSNCLVNIRMLAEGAPKAATMSFTPRLFSTFGGEYPYEPEAECPRWMQYLDECQPNLEDRLSLQMMFGLCLVPDTSFDVFFLLYGDGGTGKSVAGRILELLVGKASVSNLTLAEFAEKHSVHLLTENLVNWVSDMPRLKHYQLQAVEGVLKQSTGGEGLKVERKHENPGRAPALARCVFATNSLPEFTDHSYGLWRRVRIIPFEQRIVGTDRQDSRLPEKLENELPGIFNWAVKGYAELLKQGPEFPLIGRGREIYEEHRGACDRTGTFLREQYQGASANQSEETKVVYEAYRTWCEANGYNPTGMNLFVGEVRRCFPGVEIVREQTAGVRRRIFAGLVQRPDSGVDDAI